MNFDLLDKISSKYKDYKIEKIKSEASKRTFYRLIKDSNSSAIIFSFRLKGKIERNVDMVDSPFNSFELSNRIFIIHYFKL